MKERKKYGLKAAQSRTPVLKEIVFIEKNHKPNGLWFFVRLYDRF